MTPLNPSLYGALKGRFGTVKISNEGCRYRARPYMSGGRKREQKVDPGEQYRVCCPYCNDKRYRLYVSYMWRTLDGNGRMSYRGMAHCQNEKCSMEGLEDELRVYVRLRTTVMHRPTDEPLVMTAEDFKEVTLPGTCVPLNMLPVNHAAIRYIEGRDFTWQELHETWGVQFCTHAEQDQEGFIPGTKIHAGLVRNRLIVPICWLGKQIGWQSRAINEHSEPKYYTMPGLPKSRILFNGDRAKEHKFGVVVEGVFDAFRVGTRAVALLGKNMSVPQRELAHAYWATGALCVMLDADAIDDMEVLQNLINPKMFRLGVFPVVLPEDMDPAKMRHDDLWALIANCARVRGIALASF